MRTRYAYSDAFFERLHRDSYGYGTVETFRNDGSATKTEYANRENSTHAMYPCIPLPTERGAGTE